MEKFNVRTETTAYSPPPYNNEEEPHEQKKPRSVFAMTDWWLWEVGGLLVSAGAIAGIVGILLAYGNKPLPEWASGTTADVVYKDPRTYKLSIGLNSVLSWLGTVARIGLLIPITKGIGQLKWVWFSEQKRTLSDLETFDSATRGLSGSAMLVWKLRGRHLAALEAVAVILAFAFDPFIQNLAVYPLRYDEDKTAPPARISTTTFYKTYDRRFAAARDLKGSVIAGLYKYDDDWKTPSFSCSSGNCTWTDYVTLGVCSSCTDLTQQLQKSCRPNTPVCNFTLPNGLGLLGDDYDQSGEQSSVNPYRTMIVSTNTAPSDVLVYKDHPSPLALIQSVTDFNSSRIFNTSTPVASECVLYPCLKKYNSSIGPSTEAGTGSSAGSTLIYKSVHQQIWEDYYVDVTNDTRHIYLKPPPGLNHSQSETYGIDGSAYSLIQKYLADLFAGTATFEGAGDWRYEGAGTQTEDHFAAAAAQEIIYNADQMDLCSSDSVHPHNVNSSIMCAVENVAEALTIAIRDYNPNGKGKLHALDGGDHATGITVVPKTWVHVQWVWLCLPIALWFISLTMLIGTAWKTTQAGIETWRTNPLPMVFLGLDAEDGDDHDPIRRHGLTEKGLTKKAERMNVRLKLVAPEGTTTLYELLRPREIRLLRITELQPIGARLEHHVLDTAPPYVALSYRWGRAPYRQGRSEDAKCQLELNGTNLEVQENLHDGLQHLAAQIVTLGCLLWVDALCINQDDLDERSLRVAMMKTIYDTASEIYAWVRIPEDEEQTRLATKMMRKCNEILARPRSSEDVHAASVQISADDPLLFPHPGTQTYVAWQGFYGIFKRNYWKRT